MHTLAQRSQKIDHLNEPMQGKLQPREVRTLCVSGPNSATQVVSRFARFRICRKKCALRHQPRSLTLFNCRSRRSRGEAIGRMKMKYRDTLPLVLHRNAADTTRRLWSKSSSHTCFVALDRICRFLVKLFISYPPWVWSRKTRESRRNAR